MSRISHIRSLGLVVTILIGAMVSSIYVTFEIRQMSEFLESSKRVTMQSIFRLYEQEHRFLKLLKEISGTNNQSNASTDEGRVDHSMQAELVAAYRSLLQRIDETINDQRLMSLGFPSKARALLAEVRSGLRTIDSAVLMLRDDDPAKAKPIIAMFAIHSSKIEDATLVYEEHFRHLTESEYENVKFLRNLQLVLLILTLVTGSLLVVQLIRQARAARYQATHDGLTDILNRHGLTEKLQESIRESKATGKKCAIMVLDLDRFKVINDMLGHGTGDLLLQASVERIQENLGRNDFFGRIGGDEFAVIANGIDARTEVSQIGVRLLNAFRTPLHAGDHRLIVGLTVGYCLYPDHGDSPARLIDRAGIAVYAGKANGKDRVVGFSSNLEQRAMRFGHIERELRNAVAAESIDIHYQPKFCLKSRQIIGAEALARWTHDIEGPIAPHEFISIAEQCGMMTELGALLIDKACADAARWQTIAPRPMHVAVNVSAQQLERGGFADIVKNTLKRHQLAPSLLEIEVTESILMDDRGNAVSTIKELRKMGVKLALDDFGTGFSSLSYLRKCQFDKIKIDRSFVSDLDDIRDSVPFIQAIVMIAEELDIRVVAEGVERIDMTDRLVELGCHEGQGFGLAKPEPNDAFEERLALDPLAGSRTSGGEASKPPKSVQILDFDDDAEDDAAPSLATSANEDDEIFDVNQP